MFFWSVMKRQELEAGSWDNEGLVSDIYSDTAPHYDLCMQGQPGISAGYDAA
jgi:hypothetical protein